jgi:carboxymethylenebutenolidase
MPETLAIERADGGTFDAYVTLPECRSAPALIIVPSIFGVTSGVKQTMARYADRGFIAIAPDFFSRTTPGPLTAAQGALAEGRLVGYDINDGVDDMRRTRDALALRGDWNGRFAVVGFCFGGRHAFLGLTRLAADAAVSFHGSNIHRHLDEADAVTKPFSFHYTAEDPLVPLDQITLIREVLRGKDGEIYVYEGAQHGFAREDSTRYNAPVAQLSEERAFAILASLKPPVKSELRS